jgi:hypothetical protein
VDLSIPTTVQGLYDSALHVIDDVFYAIGGERETLRAGAIATHRRQKHLNPSAGAKLSRASW